MHYITDILYWISTGLLVPVVLILIFLFIRALLLVGSFFGQYLSIRRTQAQLQESFNNLTAANCTTLGERLPAGDRSLAVRHIRMMLDARDEPAQVQRIVSEFEIAADRDLGLSKILSKMGPMMGLMGTLIPMGPALVGLSTGDIASMAYNMQVAFATTVIGLFAAAVGFITQQVKQRWYLQDMTRLELLATLLQEHSNTQARA
jgi:biopolymer transport protein ExbB/TolQ